MYMNRPGTIAGPGCGHAGLFPPGPGWNLPGREARWRSAHLARLSALLITRSVLEDGADYGLRRSDAAGLAGPLDAERVYFGWQLGEGNVERRQVIRPRQGIVCEGAAEQLTRLPIVNRVFEQRLSDALGKST